MAESHAGNRTPVPTDGDRHPNALNHLAIDERHIKHLRKIPALNDLFDQFNSYLQRISDALQDKLPDVHAKLPADTNKSVSQNNPLYGSSELGKDVSDGFVSGGKVADNVIEARHMLADVFDEVGRKGREVHAYFIDYSNMRNAAINGVIETVSGVNDKHTGVIVEQDRKYRHALRQLELIQKASGPHSGSVALDLDREKQKRADVVAAIAGSAT